MEMQLKKIKGILEKYRQIFAGRREVYHPARTGPPGKTPSKKELSPGKTPSKKEALLPKRLAKTFAGRGRFSLVEMIQKLFLEIRQNSSAKIV